MSIDWDRLGQQRFDRVVEALVLRRFGDSVRAVNGRGGDDGIDIDIADDRQLHIQQLKYFPEGFSGGYSGTRRRQIRNSFNKAAAHDPDEWTLIVPCVLTTAEDAFVRKLGASHKPPITTGVVDRDTLDSWLADDPDLDTYFQRDPTTTLERYARAFQQEQAALLGGIEDLATRVGALGGIADTADPDWTVDFSRTSDAVSVTVRPQHPGAGLTNPLRMHVQLGELESSDLRKHLERTLGYGSSEPIRIPREVVETIRIEGPKFLAGEQPPGNIEVRAWSLNRRPRSASPQSSKTATASPADT